MVEMKHHLLELSGRLLIQYRQMPSRFTWSHLQALVIVAFVLSVVLFTQPGGIYDDFFPPAPIDPDDICKGFLIHSQADADKLRNCTTIRGNVYIDAMNATTPIVIDGPVRIMGTLSMPVHNTDPGFDALSMKTLEYVDENIGLWEVGWDTAGPVYLKKLDFPALKSVKGTIQIRHFRNLTTINLPVLENGGKLAMTSLPALHTIDAPKLHNIQSMDLSYLPSMHILSFDACLKGAIDSLIIKSTGLNRIDGFEFNSVREMSISNNKNLTRLAFPSTKVVTPRASWEVVSTSNNSRNFVLDMPSLEVATGQLRISNHGGINIPSLQRVGAIVIGSHPNSVPKRPNCEQYTPPYLNTFSAPMLKRVNLYLEFNACPGRLNISLPSLKLAENIHLTSLAKIDTRKGIHMPNLRQVGSVEIVGSEPRCEGFDNLECRGVIVGNYACQTWKGESEKTNTTCVGEPRGGLCLSDRLGFLWDERWDGCGLFRFMKSECWSRYTDDNSWLGALAVVLGLLLILISGMLTYSILTWIITCWRREDEAKNCENGPLSIDVSEEATDEPEQNLIDL